MDTNDFFISPFSSRGWGWGWSWSWCGECQCRRSHCWKTNNFANTTLVRKNHNEPIKAKAAPDSRRKSVTQTPAKLVVAAKCLWVSGRPLGLKPGQLLVWIIQLVVGIGDFILVDEQFRSTYRAGISGMLLRQWRHQCRMVTHKCRTANHNHEYEHEHEHDPHPHPHPIQGVFYTTETTPHPQTHTPTHMYTMKWTRT